MAKKLAALLSTLEGVPEQFHEYYEKGADGQYKLTIDGTPAGFVERNKLDEFRTSNIELKKQLEALSGKTLSDEELAEYRELQKEIQAVEEKGMIDEGAIEELVAQRTERMRTTYESQIAALTTKQDQLSKSLNDANSHLSSVVIDSEVSRAVTGVGKIRQGAMTDILGRARAVWKVVDGKPVAMNGDTPVYSADGRTPLTFTEWSTGLLESAPYLFEGSGGSGAGGGAGGTGGAAGGGGGGGKVIARGDVSAFSSNLADIASGKVTVKG